MNSISFHKVAKRFGNNRILEDFSLAVPAEVTTALVGESGSGKSTLLMLSNGLITPDAGSVMVMNRAIAETDLVKLRRSMGYAVQGGGLFPHLTVRENVALVPVLEGWSTDAIEARLIELFDLLGLDMELAARYPHSLSGGQQQRVSLCRAMMLDPPLLLLDEPFSALDPLTRASIHEEFARLQDISARSILLVTHDMQEAIRLAQHIVILQEGRVVQEGSVEEVVNNPGADYVAALLGASRA